MAVFVHFHRVNMDTLHAELVLLRRRKRPTPLRCGNKQEKLQLVVSLLPQEMLASGIPACSKTQVKGSISRFEAQATRPEGGLYRQLSRMQLLLRHRNAALQVLSICRTDRKPL